ncbi:MAG: hypothetical protein LBP59_07260 [Planctomycetaceae bacterium]|jgi:3-deoxy-D-manno-octulosonic-acid transferase|nr:hypothetical protein [Planctomycetaceae bacterium]
MKAFLLNILYIFLLLFYLPVLIYNAVYYGKYRAGFKEKFFGRIVKRCEVVKGLGDKEYVIWFHAVSVGEVRLLRPLLRLAQENHPDWRCVISTTSRTGMEVAKRIYGDDWRVFYCPLDFSWAVSAAVKRLQPDLLVLVEQEFWPNLIDTANRCGVKLAVINGRFSDAGYERNLWGRPFIASMLRRLDAVAVQSETYANWFSELGALAEAIHVTGSMKFDGAVFDRDNAETAKLRLLAGIESGDVVFVAGSTQSPEELFAVECYKNLCLEFPALRLIIVPRHEERFGEVAKLLDGLSVEWERRSLLTDVKFDAGDADIGNDLFVNKNFVNENFCNNIIDNDENIVGKGIVDNNVDVDKKNIRNFVDKDNCDVVGKDIRNFNSTQKSDMSQSYRPRILLVDKMGELGAWWGLASIAFVGGSIGKRGGQNMIEPAAYGAAVCFGPNTKNFRDITDLLLRADGANVICDQHELEIFVRKCLTSNQFANKLGSNAQKLVKQQQGATKRTLTILENLLKNK